MKKLLISGKLTLTVLLILQVHMLVTNSIEQTNKKLDFLKGADSLHIKHKNNIIVTYPNKQV